MESNTRPSDSSNRLRLADVRFAPGENRLEFDGGLAGVLTEREERSAAARWIATSALGPESPGADGSADLADRLASNRSLPTLLLPPSAPAVLDANDLRERWQAVCAQRSDELAAIHASQRLERHRIEAALDGARARLRASAAPPPAVADTNVLHEDPAADASAGSRQVRSHIHTLLLAIDAMLPVPSPEALLLADAWEAHTELARVIDSEPAGYVETLVERVNRARIAVAMSSGGVGDEARAEIDRHHRLVVEAEAQLFEARRKGRAQAVERYEAAVAAEKAALAEAGVDSYAAFLVAITGGAHRLDPGAQRAAREDLAASSAALDAARQLGAVPTRVQFDARSVELRARAEELLGRAVVGGDPPAELRALRVEAPGRADRVRQLAAALDAAGIATPADPVRAARDLLATDPTPPAHNWVAATPHGSHAEPVAPNPADERVALAARERELEALERQRLEYERSLTDLDSEIARLGRLRDAGISYLMPGDLAAVMESLLDAYRVGNMLGGRLPVVFDGTFDAVALDAREAAMAVLARTRDVQSIVVTDDLEVMKSLTQAGGTIVLRPNASDSPNGDPAIEHSWERRP